MIRAKVLSITDGDTFKVRLRGEKKTIRIACIDAPEMSEDPWGLKAKDALTGMLRVGSKVNLMEHAPTDMAERLLRSTKAATRILD